MAHENYCKGIINGYSEKIYLTRTKKFIISVVSNGKIIKL